MTPDQREPVYLAHSANTAGGEHALKEHLRAVGNLARHFASNSCFAIKGLGHDSVGKKELKKQASDEVDSLYLRQGGRIRCNQIVSHRCLEFEALAWLVWNGQSERNAA